MALDTLDYELIMLLTNKLTCKNFRNLSNDLGDCLVLLEALYLYPSQDTLKSSHIIRAVDICAREIDLTLNSSKKVIIEDIEKSIIRSINRIEGSIPIKY